MVKYEKHTLHDGTVLKISNQQWNFARYFALSGNATKARLKAKYKDNKNTNKVEAYKLLQNPTIQEAYEHHKVLLSRKIDISENRLIAETAAIGLSNPKDVMRGAEFIPLEEMPEATQRAIKKVTTKDGEIIAIEFHPKLPALQTIMELKGMKETKNNQPIQVTVNIDGQAKPLQIEQKKVNL